MEGRSIRDVVSSSRLMLAPRVREIPGLMRLPSEEGRRHGGGCPSTPTPFHARPDTLHEPTTISVERTRLQGSATHESVLERSAVLIMSAARERVSAMIAVHGEPEANGERVDATFSWWRRGSNPTRPRAAGCALSLCCRVRTFVPSRNHSLMSNQFQLTYRHF